MPKNKKTKTKQQKTNKQPLVKPNSLKVGHQYITQIDVFHK